jgi:hypothetical protein
MRETFFLKGKKIKINDPLGDGKQIVAKSFDQVYAYGQICHWGYYLDTEMKNIVAEAWMSRDGTFWWLRIKS